MKNNQNDQINRNKISDKSNQKPVAPSTKKGSDPNSSIIKNNRLDTDVLGMQEGNGAGPANKIHGNSVSQKDESKTGKNNLKKGNF
jgi:hypothetical protein